MEKVCGFCGKKIMSIAERIGDKWYHERCWHKQLAKNHPLQGRFEYRKYRGIDKPLF